MDNQLPSRTAKAKELLTGIKQTPKKKSKFNKDDVVYDVSKNKLLHIKRSHENYFLCSGFTDYYTDSKTNILRQKLSYDYIHENCIKVESPDAIPELHYDGIGWRVYDENE